ncbi:MAG: response regulator [Bacteroidales bacterium]
MRKINRQIVEKDSRIESAEKKIKELKALLKEERERMARDMAESERIYGIMLSSAEDGIALYDNDWNVKFANSAFYSLIGYNEKEYWTMIREKGDSTILHPDDTGFSETRSRAIEKNGYFEDEIRLRHKLDGRYIVLSSKSVKIKSDDGEPLGILVISRDITSFREAQNELIIAKEKAEESNRLKTSFLANISHEIRTPLNSIVGFANLLNDVSTNEQVREEYIGYLNQNTERLLQIISDIIDLSRLENSEIEIHYNPMRINSVVDYIEEYSKALISKSGKEIEFSGSRGLVNGRDIIYADEMWLKRVFRHLADNAVKFTRAGSIEIKYVLAGTSLMFTIKDTGIGISRDSLKSIFEQFRQEQDGHHRPFEGLGVGLTLAKHVIEQMDGYLWVESEKGSGSEFFFTIPYRPVDSSSVPAPKKEKEEPVGEVNWDRKKILVVDDNLDVLRYLNRILSDTGVSVVLARSGEEAVKTVHENSDIDLVLLDLQMAEMNGLEATQEIRKIRGDIPIIAQTAFVFEQDEDKILEAGCDACLIKPVRKDQLLSLLATFFNKS